jgi:hypothetical protein
MSPCTITSEDACIVITVGQSVKRLLKHHIVAVSAHDGRMVEIELSTPLKKIFLQARLVTAPVAADAYELSQLITAMIADCVCCKFIINPV